MLQLPIQVPHLVLVEDTLLIGVHLVQAPLLHPQLLHLPYKALRLLVQQLQIVQVSPRVEGGLQYTLHTLPKQPLKRIVYELRAHIDLVSRAEHPPYTPLRTQLVSIGKTLEYQKEETPKLVLGLRRQQTRQCTSVAEGLSVIEHRHIIEQVILLAKREVKTQLP